MMSLRTGLLILSLGALLNSERIHVPSFSPVIDSKFTTTQFVPSNLLANPNDIVQEFVKTLGYGPRDYKVTNMYKTKHTGITHIYLRQLYKGVQVANGDMNINVRNGKILSFGNSFAKQDKMVNSVAWGSSSSGFADPKTALATLLKHVKIESKNVSEKQSDSIGSFEFTGVPQANVNAQQAYLHTEDGKIVPTWQFLLQTNDNAFNAHVSADGATVLALNDWVSDASYNVIKLGDSDPVTTPTVDVENPEDKKASPEGWHKSNETFTVTKGNNVWAVPNNRNSNNTLPDGGADHLFNFTYDLTKDPINNLDAATTNLFYWNNIMHDVFYQYGFDEEAGNFQTINYSDKGKGGDQVMAFAQDRSGTDNANFYTPPDGQNGRMRMYVFTQSKPNRDGDMEPDIIAHEYGHGISNRLTGGPANSNCLGWGQPGGMGEGWSDFFAVMLQMKPEYKADKDFGVGLWVFNNKTIRNYYYSTNMTTNPTTFGYLNKSAWSEVHAIGEIWCNMLYEAYHSLNQKMEKFNPNVYTADKTSANTLLLQSVIDGMKLQPCNPNFVQARDAILQGAKANNATPDQICALWKAFAKRGLGAKAAVASRKVTEDFNLPSDC